MNNLGRSSTHACLPFLSLEPRASSSQCQGVCTFPRSVRSQHLTPPLSLPHFLCIQSVQRIKSRFLYLLPIVNPKIVESTQRNMTSDRERKTRRIAVTGPSLDRQDLAALFALLLAHFCVKMFLSSLYATVIQINADPSGWIVIVVTLIISLVDIVVFFCFNELQHSVTESNLLCQTVCGAVFMVAYNLCLLPYATTDVDVLRITSWLTFLFTSGCMAELKMGLVQKCVYALADV